MLAHQYNFIVTVQEDGLIDIEWADSYLRTIDVETGDSVLGGDSFLETLDDVLGYCSSGPEPDDRLITPTKPQALRNLANHIESLQGDVKTVVEGLQKIREDLGDTR